MGLMVELCEAPIAPVWDEFLASIPGNHHAQTSRWGQLKTSDNGKVVRLMARQDGDIVGGAQVMLRHVPVLGDVGYVPRGPVTAEPDPSIVELLLQALRKLAHQLGLRYLLMQPPEGENVVEEGLPEFGFNPSSFAPQPTATVKVDLRCDCDALFSQMKKRTRRQIRRGLSAGLTGREGNEEDLPTFHHLLSTTARRQGFTPMTLGYLEAMWRLLAPLGWLKLFIVERGDEPISSQLVVPFGDTVLTKSIGWSGRESSLGPNQLLDWVTMQWAKRDGYHFYDLEGIDADLAERVRSGCGVVTPEEHGRTYYKLNYGGEIVLEPGGYEYVEPALLRWIYQHGIRHLLSPQFLDRLAARFRAQ